MHKPLANQFGSQLHAQTSTGRRTAARAAPRAALLHPQHSPAAATRCRPLNSGSSRGAASSWPRPSVAAAATDDAELQPWEVDWNAMGPAFKATLDLIEWPLFCDHVASFASTAVGKRLCRRLEVPLDQPSSERLLAETRWVSLGLLAAAATVCALCCCHATRQRRRPPDKPPDKPSICDRPPPAAPSSPWSLTTRPSLTLAASTPATPRAPSAAPTRAAWCRGRSCGGW